MSVTDLLPWLNLLMVPLAYHVIKTESRITRLETQMQILLARVGVVSK